MFIECGVAARSDYLVTGDKSHLLKLKCAHGILIVAVSEFFALARYSGKSELIQIREINTCRYYLFANTFSVGNSFKCRCRRKERRRAAK